MEGTPKRAGTTRIFLGEAEEIRLLDLLAYLDDKIPEAYRVELLSFLLPRALPRQLKGAATDSRSSGPAQGKGESKGKGRLPKAEESSRLEMKSYATLFGRRGDTLLKALAALHVAETQLDVNWLTPAEIVRLLSDMDASHRVYRSNVSNVLRTEQALVLRRPRGRGYEYALTTRGRAWVVREVSLLGLDLGSTEPSPS